MGRYSSFRISFLKCCPRFRSVWILSSLDINDGRVMAFIETSPLLLHEVAPPMKRQRRFDVSFTITATFESESNFIHTAYPFTIQESLRAKWLNLLNEQDFARSVA